jgi:hypothetical protein
VTDPGAASDAEGAGD